MRVIVIMAGGSGTRFWPMSRKAHPKQLLALTGEQSMLADTVDRVEQSVPRENVYIVAGPDLIEAIRADLPDLPAENFLVEPEGRNTAPCLAFAAAVIAGRHGPDTAMGVMTADHLIRDTARFAENSDLAFEQCERDPVLVTFGIRPTEPNTGFGYIEMGQAVTDNDARGAVYQVQGFREKPDLQTAKRYFESGQYLWNSGMFFWRVSTLIEAFERFKPDMAAGAREIAQAVGKDDFQSTLERIFHEWDKDSIDYAVMEKADNVRVVPAGFDWDDVGTWTALARTQPLDAEGNLLRGRTLALDTKNSILFNRDPMRKDSPRLLAALGVEDLIVVSAGDAILVCPRERVQDIKQVHAALGEDEDLARYL